MAERVGIRVVKVDKGLYSSRNARLTVGGVEDLATNSGIHRIQRFELIRRDGPRIRRDTGMVVTDRDGNKLLREIIWGHRLRRRSIASEQRSA